MKTVLKPALASDDSDGERATLAAGAHSVGEVYAAHSRYVFRCLRSLGVRECHVEDAVHDVFLVVHEKLSDFRGPAKLRTWLYAIVLRVARRYRERQAHEGHLASIEASDGLSAEHKLLSLEQLALARAALDALSEEKREVFLATRQPLDRALLEKVVLVTLVTLIFAQILPNYRGTNLGLAVAATIVITLNSFVSYWFARRGLGWRSALIQFGAQSTMP